MSDKRKKDHIDLSFTSVPDKKIDLGSSTYEPLLSPHPDNSASISKTFLNHNFGMPLWISSMTGGTEKAKHINRNLAKACGEFKLGMGLGSCRQLLDSDKRFHDFYVKDLMNEMPLYANMGIAQLEELIDNSALSKLTDIITKLDADGLVIHVNPLQEWAQKEGDRFKRAPLDTITFLCENLDTSIIVKEVGQGMGPRSLKALLDLPLDAIELASYGGTNFSILERARANAPKAQNYESPKENFGYIGHTAEEMINYLNALEGKHKHNMGIIISGGIKDPLAGHILQQKLEMNSVIGMASNVLKYALQDYSVLQSYLLEVRECFAVADAYITKG